MSPVPFRYSAEGIDLSPRVFRDTTVDASPAAAAETVIATLSVTPDLPVGLGVLVLGWCSLTVGTAGVSIVTRIRRDSVTGTIIAASGATTATAANLVDRVILGIDTSAALPNEVYVLTLQVASASAESTVSAVQLVGIVL